MVVHCTCNGTCDGNCLIGCSSMGGCNATVGCTDTGGCGGMVVVTGLACELFLR